MTPSLYLGGHLLKAKSQEDYLLHISRAGLSANYFDPVPLHFIHREIYMS